MIEIARPLGGGLFFACIKKTCTFDVTTSPLD